MPIRVTAKGLNQLALQLRNLGPVLERVGERAIEALQAEAVKDTGGDLILSNFGKGRRAGRIKLKVLTRESKAGMVLTLRGVPPGPWTLLEAGSSKSEWTIPRQRRRRTATQAKPLHFGGDEFAHHVTHGPVRAKRTWSRGAPMVVQATSTTGSSRR